ncbi:MAG: hypothetical protein JWP91_1416 [Fibrobacteres bacterium]|nr:hypothetical protein [Fibrobacterota bacterium]
MNHSPLRATALALLALTGALFAQDDAKWSLKFGTPGLMGPVSTSGFAHAVAVAPNGDVYAGGIIAYAGTAKSNNIARYNKAKDAWEAMGTGLAGTRVRAIAISGSDVYAGGELTLAGNADGNVAISNIAKWDTVTRKWSALGAGIGGASTGGIPTSVNSMIVSGGMLYVGGRFTTAGGVTVANVAVWDIAAGEWKAMGAGLNNNGFSYVLSLAAKGNTVYAAGSLSILNGSNLSEGMAVWDGNAWAPMGTGFSMAPAIMPAKVNALTVSGDSLYAVGQFQYAPGVVAKGVAVYNFTSKIWTALGGDGNGPTGVELNAVAVSGKDLFIGGNFASDIYGNTVNHVIQFDLAAKTASNLKQGLTQGQSPTMIMGMAIGDGNLYIGGQFTHLGGLRAENVARWDIAAKAWSALGANGGVTPFVNVGPAQSPAHVKTLAGDADGNIYAGGTFFGAGDAGANHVAVWNGKAWDSLGAGLTGTTTFSGVSIVNAIASIGKDVYVGGAFYKAGTVTTPNIARWDRTAKTWNALGGGAGSGINSVTCLATLNDQVYVGGTFTYVMDTENKPAAGVARWTPATNTWKVLAGHSILNPHVLLAIGKDIYLGGNGVKKRNETDTTWQLVEGAGDVRAMAESDSILYMGGYFSGPMNAQSIVKLDLRTKVLSRLGDSSTNGLRAGGTGQGTVNGISKVPGGIVVVGQFTLAGGKLAKNAAFWHEASQTWYPLGSGLDDIAMASYSVADTAYVAGNFNTAGGTLSTRIAAYAGMPALTVAVRPSARAPASSGSALRMRSGSLELSLASASRVSIALFDFKGKGLGGFAAKRMGAGGHRIAFAKPGSGPLVYRLTLKSEGKPEAVTSGMLMADPIQP